jgi:alanyl-tRNA synthetase
MTEEEKTVQCLTTKEIKALAKPEFAANPDKFYPVETFKKLGFSRTTCPKCGHNFWRHSESRTTCGDSNCEGQYSFIGNGFLPKG